MTRRLIVNADDFGRSTGVSMGILQAHKDGIVTSTTAMMNLPQTASHLAMARKCPGLGLGVHLVFCSWRPLLPPEEVPGLVDADGFFFDQHTFWARADEIPPDQLRAELTAQVEQFGGLMGRLPDHLDCHQFVHAHPRFFALYLDLAEEFRLPVRLPFSPATDWDLYLLLAPFLKGTNPEEWEHMVAADRDMLKGRAIAHPDQALTTFFGPELTTLDNLLHILDTMPPGASELICHPGWDEQELAGSGYRNERQAELTVLVHPAVRERIRDLDIELVTFAALT